MVVFPQN